MLRVSLLLIVAFVAGACGGSRSTIAPSPNPLTQQVVVLGDSLAISPSVSEGFPAVLEARLRQRGFSWTVVNAGMSGDTTGVGLQRLDAVIADRPQILIVALGANDGLRAVAVGSVKQNLSQIVERAQARGIKVLLCGMEMPPIHGLSYTAAFHDVFPGVAATYKVPLVPFLLEGVALNPVLNGDDLIHPNAAGARKIADTIWPYLEPIVAASVASSDQSGP